MQKFTEEDWFKIAIVLLLLLLPFLLLLPIVSTEAIGYNYLEKIESFAEFADKNLLRIIFLCLAYYLAYYGIYSINHNHKILEEYKRENNGNDNKYTAKFCEEDCVFDCINTKEINKTVINKTEDKERIIKKEHIKETISNSGDKILDRDDKIYLVDENCYHHIVNGYTFRKLGYPSPNKYKSGCFSKEGKELKEEIKIHNIISDIKNILDIKNNI